MKGFSEELKGKDRLFTPNKKTFAVSLFLQLYLIADSNVPSWVSAEFASSITTDEDVRSHNNRKQTIRLECVREKI